MSKSIPVHPVTGEILNHKGQRLTESGEEILDPTPIAPPVGYVRQKPLHQLIREMVMSEKLRQEAEALDKGSFEDEDDFDVGDDLDPSSPWEENFDPLEGAPEALRNPSESPEAPPAKPVEKPAPKAKQGSGQTAPESATDE